MWYLQKQQQNRKYLQYWYEGDANIIKMLCTQGPLVGSSHLVSFLSFLSQWYLLSSTHHFILDFSVTPEEQEPSIRGEGIHAHSITCAFSSSLVQPMNKNSSKLCNIQWAVGCSAVCMPPSTACLETCGLDAMKWKYWGDFVSDDKYYT